MTPAPRDHRSSGVAVQLKPIGLFSRRQLEQAAPMEKSLLPLKKRALTSDYSFVIPPSKPIPRDTSSRRQQLDQHAPLIDRSLLPPKKRAVTSYTSSSEHEHQDLDLGAVAVQSKPIPADPRDRSVAGDDTPSRRLLDIEKSLLPLKKRALTRDYSFGIEKSLLPLKKRAVVTSDSFVIPTKKRRVDDAKEEAAPPSSNENTSNKQPLQQKKVVHGGILIISDAPYGTMDMEEAETARAKKKKNRNKNRRMEEDETSAAGAARVKKKTKKKNEKTVPVFPLRAELILHVETLGATAAPQFICRKTLYKTDVDSNQNRLLFSCKEEFVADHPITSLLDGNKRETFFVHKCVQGLLVRTLDGRGNEFDLRLRYLTSNGGFRLIDQWNDLVSANKLAKAVNSGRCVDVEVWAFRSLRSLPVQPLLKDQERREEKQRIVDGLEEHPNGTLGLLLRTYIDGKECRRDVDDGAEEERERAPPPVHETAKVVIREEKTKVAHHRVVRANRGKAAVMGRVMTTDEVLALVEPEEGEPFLGLLMLKRSSAACCPPRSNTYA